MGLFLSIFLIFGLRAQTPYSLADLEVLVSDGAVEEFFAHALDIRPAQRQQAWRGMMIKMGDVFTRRLLDKSDLARKDFDQLEKLYALPPLKQDDVFKSRRHALGLRYIKSCFKNSEDCWPLVKSFWEQDQTDPETAHQLAELTLTHKESPLSTWTFLEVALKSSLSGIYCQKAPVMSALWGKLEMDYFKLGPEGDLLKKIDQTVHPDCLPALLSETRKRLHAPVKAGDRELAFQILKASGKASEEISDFFYTVYLLDNPAQGELFNYAWNRVQELGGAFSRREKVLNSLKALDPLPDGLFASLDDTKRRVVLRHLRTHFPEYFDHYTDQCILFYSGQGTFPNGNPAVHCSSFMTSDLAPLMVDETRMKKFLRAKNI
jgi:hypothetical protein